MTEFAREFGLGVDLSEVLISEQSLTALKPANCEVLPVAGQSGQTAVAGAGLLMRAARYAIQNVASLLLERSYPNRLVLPL